MAIIYYTYHYGPSLVPGGTWSSPSPRPHFRGSTGVFARFWPVQSHFWPIFGIFVIFDPIFRRRPTEQKFSAIQIFPVEQPLDQPCLTWMMYFSLFRDISEEIFMILKKFHDFDPISVILGEGARGWPTNPSFQQNLFVTLEPSC